jgi:hypothetical protein
MFTGTSLPGLFPYMKAIQAAPLKDRPSVIVSHAEGQNSSMTSIPRASDETLDAKPAFLSRRPNGDGH